MNPQLLIPLTPFLALLYVFYALIQALRHKRQGLIAGLLALIAMITPIVALVLTKDSALQAQIVQLMALNAGIVFVGSLLILVIERRNSERDLNRSYGMLGIGLSILLAAGIFITPILSNVIPGSAASANSAVTAQQAQLAQVLTQQTGLATADLVIQIQGGSTIAELVAAHNGDLNAVTVAFAAELDQMTAAGGRAAQFMSALGSSSSDIASKIVQGQIPAQMQRLVTALIQPPAGFGGGAGNTTTQGGNGTGNGGFGGNTTDNAGNGAANTTTTQGGNGTGNGGFGGFGGNNSTSGTAQITSDSSSTAATPSGNGGFGGFGGSTAGNSTAQTTPAGSGFGGFGGNTNTAQQTTTQATPVPAATTDAQGETPVAQVLTAQTGLSTSDLTAQMQSGSTIAQLVTAHNGDLNAVISAFAAAIDQLTASGGRAAQALANFGTDSTDIANKIVQGQLPAQGQFLVNRLITGATGFGGNGGGAGNGSGNGGFGGGNANGTGAGNTQQTAPLATNTPTPEPTLQPSPTVIRPTRIVFPTATPTLAETEAASTAEATSAVSASTCTLTVNFNLNLRDKPSKDGSNVLVSIPLGSSVTADKHTSDDWYSVSYDGKSGWVSGDYVSPSAACSSLPAS